MVESKSENKMIILALFGLDDINDLPIIYNIAWYEQKAVIVLLALLYLGVIIALTCIQNTRDAIDIA